MNGFTYRTDLATNPTGFSNRFAKKLWNQRALRKCRRFPKNHENSLKTTQRHTEDVERRERHTFRQTDKPINNNLKQKDSLIGRNNYNESNQCNLYITLCPGKSDPLIMYDARYLKLITLLSNNIWERNCVVLSQTYSEWAARNSVKNSWDLAYPSCIIYWLQFHRHSVHI